MVEWKKLGEVCQVLNGFAFKSSEYVPMGIRIIRISDVQNGYISDKDKVFYPIEKLSEFERYLLNNGDLVMSLTGNPGRVAFIRNESCALNQRVACLRAKTVSNSYLFYLFNCKEFESTAFANSTGGAQKNLSTTWLNNYLIPIPSLEEQTRIVGILDTFTSAIDNLKEQIAQRRKQYEYYRDQLLDLEGKPGVEMKTLGEVGKCVAGATPSTKISEYWEDGDIPWMSSGEVHQGNVTHTASFITQEGYNNSSTKMLPVNTIVIALAGQGKTRGSVAITKIELCTNQSLCGVIINNEKIINKYIFYYLKTRYNDLRKISSGDGTRGGLNLKMIGSYPIPLPPLSEQQRIVSILDTFEGSIQNLEAQLEQREKQYEYYRNKLLTFE